MKKLILLIAVSAIISMMMTSCSLISGNTGSEKQGTDIAGKRDFDDIIDMGPVKGGTLKLFSTAPDTLNPVLSANAYVQEFSGLIFEGLVKLDRNMKPLPVLAKSWDVSEDGLTWTFHIRENVQWHDRMRLTAEDVEFTISVILDSKVDSVYKNNLKNISSFSVLDEYTIKIVLKSPYSFLAEMMTFPVLPRHYFYGDEISNLKSARNMKPVGTGPYRYISSDDTVIKLGISEGWWAGNIEDNAGKSLPYISEVEIKLLGSTTDAVNALQTRDVDIITIDAGSCNKYMGRSDIIIKKYPGRDYEFLAFNLSSPVMEDPFVRRAIAQAVDKQKLINDILPGEAVAADISVIPDTWMYDTNVISIKPDAAKARQLLLDSGWKENTGVLYKRIKGITTPLSIEILVNEDNAKRIRVAEEICKQLAEAGIGLKIKKVSWEEEMKLINTRKYDLVLMGCKTPVVPDISYKFSTLEIAGGLNIAGYSNAGVDNYLNRILAENDDMKKKAYLINARNLIEEDVPYIGLYFYYNATIFNKRIRGQLNPYIWDKLYGIEKWYLPEG